MDTALIVTLVFSIVTAILVIIELIVNFHNSKKERNIKTVTEQRANWIQEIRSLFTDIIDLFDLSIDSLITIERKYNNPNNKLSIQDEQINVLRKKYNKLRLFLNFENDADKKLISAIEDLICRIDLEKLCTWLLNFPDYSISDFVASKELIILYMHIYLKSEWERLKKESKTGETSSKFFEEKYKTLMQKNDLLINKLSSKAYRIKLSEIIQYLESNDQFKQLNMDSYNCLNLKDLVN